MTDKQRIGCASSIDSSSFMPCHTCDYEKNPEHCRGYRAKKGYIEVFEVVT